MMSHAALLETYVRDLQAQRLADARHAHLIAQARAAAPLRSTGGFRPMELLAFVLLLVAFDVAALRFGRDSRDGFTPAPSSRPTRRGGLF